MSRKWEKEGVGVIVMVLQEETARGKEKGSSEKRQRQRRRTNFDASNTISKHHRGATGEDENFFKQSTS